MSKRNQINNLTFSAMFLALAFVLPFLTGQIPQIGSMLCPMHIPVLLCGFICGAPWGLAVGFTVPLLRSFVIGMPLLFPTAICMAFELGAYGLFAGILHAKLPKKKIFVYVSLLGAMLIGRVIWGLSMLACVGFDTSGFGLAAFVSGTVITAIPGIILQFLLVPMIVFALEKYNYSVPS